LSPATLADHPNWKQIPTQDQLASFQGDAVITNGRVLAVLRKSGFAAELYARTADGLVPRLRLRLLTADGRAADHLEQVALVENARGAACLEAFYRTTDGSAITGKFRIKRGEVSVQVAPVAGAGRLRVECPSRFLVLPDLFADDIVIDAIKALPAAIEVPSENFLLHLADQGNAIAACVFENRQQDVKVTLTGQGEQRALGASEIDFEGKSVWVALLESPHVWHTMDLKAESAGKVLPLSWKMPFAAQWRVDFSRPNELTDSWEMLLQETKDGEYVKPSLLSSDEDRIGPDRKRWNTVLGYYPYPCFSNHLGQGFVQPLNHKALQFRGPLVVYPINRVKQTPLDTYTVVDVMRNTLGVGPCEHILDLEGQKAEYKGRATCSCRDELGAIYAKGQQKAKRAEVEKILDDGLIFVKHIRGRITRYVEFGHRMREYLAEQKKLHPELGDFLNEMDKITLEIDARVAARADKIQTPSHVALMNAQFRKDVLEDYGRDALAKCQAYTAALVVIGDNQDELSGECRWVVKSLRQRAGIRMALDPRVATVAGEIRARTQQALRNPASHEGAGH
jgi:hypothetical protein